MSIVWGKLNINLAEHQEAYEEAKCKLGITDAGVLSASQLSAAVQLAELIRKEKAKNS